MVVISDLSHCVARNVKMLDTKSVALPRLRQQSEVSTHMLAENQWISLGRHGKDNGQIQWQVSRPTCNSSALPCPAVFSRTHPINA